MKQSPPPTPPINTRSDHVTPQSLPTPAIESVTLDGCSRNNLDLDHDHECASDDYEWNRVNLVSDALLTEPFPTRSATLAPSAGTLASIRPRVSFMQEMKRHRNAKRARRGDGELRMPTRSASSSSISDDNHRSSNSNNHSVQLPLSDSVESIGITELLEQDSRPTFILDLLSPEKEVEGRIKVVWSNKSLKFFDELRRIIYADTFYPSATSPTPLDSFAAAEAEFKEWATCFPDFDSNLDGYLPRHTFKGMFWTSTTLRHRWRVISASQVPNQRTQSHGTPRSSRSNSRSTSATRSKRSSTEDYSTDTAITEESELEMKLADSESKFKVLTELNPVGMYYLTPDGNILYCNDMWYEITGHPRGLESEMSFMNVLSEIDHPKMGVEWELLTKGKGKRTFELRLRKPWIDDKTGESRQKWILASCDQEFDEDGNLKTIMGCSKHYFPNITSVFAAAPEPISYAPASALPTALKKVMLTCCLVTDISAQKHAEEDALARANLVEKLALRTQEAAQHEKNFQQMAELAPCGMFTFTPEGIVSWANPQWYEMTGHARDPAEHHPMSILDCIEQQDREAFMKQWQKIIVAKEEVGLELRLKKPWIRQESNEAVRDPKWILFLALPQLDDHGNLTKILGCTTDISGVKLAEHVQLVSRLHAEEAKRNQESFIDMTSHEMRNPLGAIMLCADGIATSVKEFQTSEDKNELVSQTKALLESNLDAAQTIVLCAQHQKRIIDDVLTLSKLNSTMVHVTPVQIDIESTVRRTLKMFDSELQADAIKMDFLVEKSYRDCQLDKVCCDPVRLTQIFINLLTNAIKFTRSEARREITINLGASLAKPTKDSAPGIQWFPSKDPSVIQDLTLTSEWGTGQQVYLYFAVRDTGRGLSEDEKKRLFHRFSQASPRTHVQYGGSGLGLFISRELTELQGGQIGVTSAEGAGSTFAFYIKARRAMPNNLTEPLASIQYVSTPSGGTTGHSSTPSTPPQPSKLQASYHILLVEDNLINQKVLSKQLRTLGCVVHVANHGGEALDFLSKTTLWADASPLEGPRMELSLILMDLEMPIMDGLAATRRIRDLEREGRLKGHVPIVAVTANTRGEQMDVAREAGMDDIVAKPFQIPELMQKMDLLLRDRRT